MSILIKNVLHQDKLTEVLIEGNRIARIASGISAPAGAEVLDGTDKAIIPGFINTHTHASMTLFRGYGDDLPLMTWLEDYIWPVEAQMTAHDVYVGARLACLEMLRSGTTCFLDMYMHPLETAKAVEEMGLRAHLSYTLFDQGNAERAELDRKRSYEYFDRFKKFSDRITFTLGPHAIYTVSGEQLQFCHQFAVEHNVKIHLHLSETKGEIDECVRQHGLTPVRYLEKLGILSEHLVLAHVVWIDDEEMDLLAKYNVSVVHNPASNLKLASGYAFKYEEMKRRGIRIGIGTDGCSSSNNLDMVVAMKLASFLGKGWRFDSTACKADDIFASATSVGADILGIPAGRVEEGALADVCLVDLNTPELVPLNSLTSNLVYATSGSSCVDTVIVDGRILMRDKYVPGQEAIIAEAREVARRLFKHA
ncbi:amidohydrolase [Porphyromonas sp. oral taxon 278]|uniref:amidohydrolase n=1 Tax=Porphyromonas sp. oral taxon 278 TaxID=712437 RepID=UPI0025DAD763|nr:amidohydrolase [Porphyromonas sp. oral taxon 278]